MRWIAKFLRMVSEQYRQRLTEAGLRIELDRAKAEIVKLQTQIHNVEIDRDRADHEVERLRAILKIRDTELSELAGVVARDLKRVEAETAIAAKTIANAVQSGR